MNTQGKIVAFDFQDHAVRVVERDSEPWFVASDVCGVLGISQHRDAIRRLDADERASLVVDTPGGEQKVGCVSESGLYHLIFKSRKPAAKRFRKWVTSDVIPAIRRTGEFRVRGEVDLQEVETDRVPRMTVPAFLMERPHLTWDETVAFGTKVRQLAQAMGISYEKVSDPELGKVRTYPVALLERAWVIFEECRLRGGLQLQLPLVRFGQGEAA